MAERGGGEVNHLRQVAGPGLDGAIESVDLAQQCSSPRDGAGLAAHADFSRSLCDCITLTGSPSHTITEGDPTRVALSDH